MTQMVTEDHVIIYRCYGRPSDVEGLIQKEEGRSAEEIEVELDERLQPCALNTCAALGSLSTQTRYKVGADELDHGHASGFMKAF